MAHWCFWLSPSPQLFFFLFFFFFVCLFVKVVLAYFISFHYLLVMQWSESVIKDVFHRLIRSKFGKLCVPHGNCWIRP